MPIGGPSSSGFGGNEERFAGRPIPPKASKSRRKIASVQYQETGEGDDGSSRGGDEEDGAEDLDPLTGKKRKRQRAGPGGDSLTCHQVSRRVANEFSSFAGDGRLTPFFRSLSVEDTTSLDFAAR